MPSHKDAKALRKEILCDSVSLRQINFEDIRE
jgi:hypothetical protein